jgi:hypothetical protein
MAMRRTVVGTVVVALAVMGIVSALSALVTTQTITNTGTIYSVGVTFYTSPSLSAALTSIAWGSVVPGNSYNYVGYAYNNQTASVTLSLAVQNWSQANAPSYLAAGWNYSGAVLAAGSITPISFTLTVNANATGSGITTFSFNYNVTATGQ